MEGMSTTASETLLRHWIAGARDEQPADRYGEVTDPATGEVVARVPFATAADVDRAVTAATGPPPSGARPRSRRRAQVMFAFRELVYHHKDELARADHARARQGALRRARRGHRAASRWSSSRAGSATCSRAR